MGGKPKSKSNTSKSKSSKSKDKKSSKDVKKKLNKSKDKSKNKSKEKSKKDGMPKVKKEKEGGNPPTNEDKENIEKSNLIQDLSGKNINQNLNEPNNNMTSINQLFVEKCEGCFQGEGFNFCSECGKIYCKTCDDQLHVIPSFRNHERIPLDTFSELKMNCYHHNQPLRLFCESCHEPICKECKRIGPHKSPLHNIDSLFGVYKKFIDISKNYLSGPLKEKSFKIEELMIQIDNLINDNKNKAKEMLHGISLEYENIIENIAKIDGKKKAELSFNASELQKDIVNIQNILELISKKNINYFNVDNGGQNYPLEEDENDKIINFLLQHKSLMNDIDQIISKPTNKILTKEDEEKILKWPKELNDSKEKLSNYPKLKKILKVKDDIIWKLLITPYEERSPELFEIEKKAEEEISKWNQLIEKTKSELSKYNLVCHFCGVPLEHGMNTLCPLNTNEIPYENKNLTLEIPPQNLIGTDKHYFSEPSENYQKKIDSGEYFDVNDYLKKRNAQQNSQNLLSSMSNLRESKKKKEKNISDLMRPSISSDWVNKSARHIEKENINLFQVLSDFDSRGAGYISIRELILALTKIRIILTEEDKESLKKYLLLSGYNEDKISIKNFAQNFGKTSTYDNLYDNNNINPQMSSNGFKNANLNINNCNKDTYFNNSMQRSMTFPMSQMINNERGTGFSAGVRY
jgi:hypothetical protein